jgi:hypothetical protein
MGIGATHNPRWSSFLFASGDPSEGDVAMLCSILRHPEGSGRYRPLPYSPEVCTTSAISMNRRLPIADAATNIYEISAHPNESGYHVHIVGSDGARQTMLGFETEAARSVLQLAGPNMCGSSLFGNREVSDLARRWTPRVRIPVLGSIGSAPDCSVLFADFTAIPCSRQNSEIRWVYDTEIV